MSLWRQKSSARFIERENQCYDTLTKPYIDQLSNYVIVTFGPLMTENATLKSLYITFKQLENLKL